MRLDYAPETVAGFATLHALELVNYSFRGNKRAHNCAPLSPWPTFANNLGRTQVGAVGNNPEEF